MSLPAAVIFDVDGTIAETERDGHRAAFNRAFELHGLLDRWDVETYGHLLATPGGKERLRRWLGGRGMEPAAVEELVPRLHATKNEVFLGLVRAGAIPVRPGVVRLLDDLAAHGVPTAVATTGSRAWVTELLAAVLGEARVARFGAVVTGEDCTRMKPDPQLYLLALERLGRGPAGVVAVEDSAAGLAAAKAAGLACLVVRNGYTRGHDVGAADLVVDDLGEAGAPASVAADPHGAVRGGVVGAETLGRLAG